MKIIISRKGFDSQNGKLPNLILPDGRLLVFPIPDKTSTILYKDIEIDLKGYDNLYELLVDLNAPKIKEHYTAHLDPDLYPNSLPRDKAWKPLFGQTGAPLRHLQKSDVGIGDLFLFFGRFQKTKWENKKIVYDKTEKDIHILFGYFSIGDIVDLKLEIPPESQWISYHSHNYITKTPNNIFVGSKALTINGKTFSGAKVFDGYSEKLRLSTHGKNKSIWKLPNWFYPFDTNRPPLTFHPDKDRWSLCDGYVELHTVGRGQEFVLDADLYPEWKKWVLNILS
ncbi:MAG: hypothetical protein WCK09_17405 [Bacteroidota bacterium]